MADLSKPINGVGLAQLNTIINGRLAKKQDAGSALTMEQVNAAINTAINSAMEETY